MSVEWNEAIEAAAKVCEGHHPGLIYKRHMTWRECANQVCALKRPEASELGRDDYAICHMHGKFYSGYTACPICTTELNHER